eukprot:TRINITY_DN57778_c0_g1_i1.p1 TRINITY_DN57778_c0_g1~~TRINITY_DN57778_c0_g1_i1.p1  ORF type:complete len:549 (+),score=133.46 TRINITY_DN57778_c0_g1_i1:31-1647(+)
MMEDGPAPAGSMAEAQIEALREALQGLTDSDGCVSAEALREVGGFDDDVADVLEAQLGPGPWPASLLEGLFGGDLAEEECISPESMSLSRRLAVVQLEDRYVEGVEDAESDDDDEEDELSIRVRAAIAAIASVHEADEMNAETHRTNLLHLLKRTWRLLGVRNKQKAHLQQQLCVAKEEAQMQEDRAARAESAKDTAELEAGRCEEIQQLLDDAEKRLISSRETLKRRDVETEEARQRVEHLEGEGLRQAQRLRQVEERLRRSEERCTELEKHDAERQAATTTLGSAAKKAEEAAGSAQTQISELARRLGEAESAIEASKEELAGAEMRCQETVAWWRQRVVHLEMELEESRRLAVDSEAKLRARLTEGAPLSPCSAAVRATGDCAGGPCGLAEPTLNHRVMRRATAPCLGALSEELGAAVAAASADDAAGPKTPSPHAFDRKARLQARLQAQKQEIGEGKTNDRHRRNSSESVLSLRSTSTTASTGSGSTGGSSSGSSQSSARRNSNRPQALPMDMRSLGKLLSGGGFLGGKRATKS